MKRFALFGALGILLAVTVGGGVQLVRLVHRTATDVVVPEPARPLLDWLAPLPLDASESRPWEVRARRDQTSHLDMKTFLDPPAEYRPWTRWWWPGNVVDPDELRRQLRDLVDHGFGGVEIQPLAAGVSEEDRASPGWTETGWDTPEFYANVRAVLREARTLGIRADLTVGSGWPGGGPHVGLDDGLQSLIHGEVQVTGPGSVSIELPTPKLPVIHWAAGWVKLLAPFGSVFVPEAAELLTVRAARVLGGRRSWNPFDLSDQLALDPATLTSLDALVDDEGRLAWDVPDGDWVVIALYRIPGGELGSAATEHPTFVLDHLDAERVRAHYDYLFGPRTGLSPFFGDPLRAFFNDSFEFKQERLWPRRVLDAFAYRYGYDPRPWLPALVRAGHDQAPLRWERIRARPEYDLGASSRRFVEDWEQLVSDLFVERFVETSTDWASRHGLASRVQAYGFDFDLLRAAGAASIPETEQMGGSRLFLKMASSGALLHDRPVVTAEAFVAKRRAYMSTPAKVKAQADQLIGAGVNQILYHGTAYQVPDPEARGYGRAGWYPFSFPMFSDDFSPQHPHWESLPEVNRYIARLQYAMRLGRPESDVLVLYPFLGFPGEEVGEESSLAGGRFDGEPIVSSASTLPLPLSSAEDDPREGWLRRTVPLLRALEAAGVAWTWVNEPSLRRATPVDGRVDVRGERFRALLLADIEALSPETAEAIERLAAGGAPVATLGALPDRQRGLADVDDGDRRVREAMARLATSPATTLGPADPQTVDAFVRTSLAGRPVSHANPALQTTRRRLASGAMLLFARNTSDDAVDVDLRFAGEGSAVRVLDPWTGRAWSPPPGDADELSLVLPPYGSRLVWIGADVPEGLRSAEVARVERSVQRRRLDRWTLRVERDAAEGGVFESSGPLADWASVDELRSSGSPGHYATSFDLDPVDGRGRVVLDLGRVAGTAHVRVNGEDAGPALVYPFTVDITEHVRSGRNDVDVTLVPPRRNAEIARRESELGALSLLLAPGERTPTGLLGPAHVEIFATD